MKANKTYWFTEKEIYVPTSLEYKAAFYLAPPILSLQNNKQTTETKANKALKKKKAHAVHLTNLFSWQLVERHALGPVRNGQYIIRLISVMIHFVTGLMISANCNSWQNTLHCLLLPLLCWTVCLSFLVWNLSDPKERKKSFYAFIMNNKVILYLYA